MSWTCQCGAINRTIDRACSACAGPRDAGPSGSHTAGPSRRTTCDCGATLLASGRCSATGGYPGSANPHDVLPSCPICRGPLEWSGACYRCFGTATGQREHWSFPGAEYQLDKGHWQETAPPGRRACSPEDNRQAWRALKIVLGGMGAI